MSDLHTIRLDHGSPPEDLWCELARVVAAWCVARGVSLRDAVVLVPFVQLIEPARRAFAGAGGWQPRIETTDTWAASLGPPPAVMAGALNASPTLDVLTAAQLLRDRAGLADWESRDPRGYFLAVEALVATAQALHQGAHARAPGAREAYWDAALEACPVSAAGMPGGLERSLARLAVEWARLSPVAGTDRLFHARPGALIWLDAGGADPLAAAVALHLEAPSLRLDADPEAERIFDAAAVHASPRVVVVDGLEAEARAVAGEVIGLLNQHQRPIALVALDRSLMRRVRALLERRGIAVADETGWALSTTRAAAAVMALLKAARRQASHDDWLDALKSWPTGRVDPGTLQQLEHHWRSGQPIEEQPAGALLAGARQALAAFDVQGRQALQKWLTTLRQALVATGLAETLAADTAGRQVLTALLLPDAADVEPTLADAMRSEQLDAEGFRAWVDRTLEHGSFMLPASPAAAVVLTPLARAVLRPFAAAVIGGADERNLLGPSRHDSLLGEPAARALGLPTATTTFERERLALAQLVRLPQVTFVRRKLEGTEPLAASPGLEALDLARRRLGRAGLDEAPPQERSLVVPPAAVTRPAPAAAEALPARLSASTFEALRACPYRFFARSVLRLRDAEELDETLDKRDYGNWLHAVLDRFHRTRQGDADDAAALRQAAETVSSELAIPRARLLPFRIGFDGLIPAYLDWLHRREARGLAWRDGEFGAERTPPELDGTRLHGRIDRIDRGPGGVSVIDYKTGSVAKLKSQLRDPFEDTQLGFYALLMHADVGEGSGFEALYLALDDPEAPREMPHEDVVRTARAMLQGMAQDLRRLRAGAGLAALGEGSTCDICEARGLCRRDHWSTAPGVVP